MELYSWIEDDLGVVWSKEGHIAGLFYKEGWVSSIPLWTDGYNFPDYARYAKENYMVSWKLADAGILIKRIEEGKHCVIIDEDDMQTPLPFDLKRQGVYIRWIVPVCASI